MLVYKKSLHCCPHHLHQGVQLDTPTFDEHRTQVGLLPGAYGSFRTHETQHFPEPRPTANSFLVSSLATPNTAHQKHPHKDQDLSESRQSPYSDRPRNLTLRHTPGVKGNISSSKGGLKTYQRVMPPKGTWLLWTPRPRLQNWFQLEPEQLFRERRPC